jgi:hypothetical protein
MADQYGHLEMKKYLPYAIVTTLAVILIPIVIVMALVGIANPNPPLFFTTLVAVVFGMLAVAGGSAWWLRRPESSEISFGDLMIWGWWRRKRAEDRLAKGTRLLGLDRSGHPRMQQTISREQQLHILRELTGALESKDPYTHGHSRRVERHVYRTSMALGLSIGDIEDLRKAAALHDVGKIRVPDRILRKPEALTTDEKAVLEDHVVVGAWMVSSAGNADVVSGVRHHHEKWDGSGYPDGLRATEIPLFSRIIAVADTFDAITSTRPYRAGADRERAIEVLRAESGRQFDPSVVEAFINTLPAPVPAAAGILVLLAGPRGIVSRMAVVLKRAGAGALAPAAGATGAVILAGASTFAPPIAHHPAPLRVAARPANHAQSAPEGAPGSSTRRPAGHRSKKPSHGAAARPHTTHPHSSAPPAIAGPSASPSASPSAQPSPSTAALVDSLALSPISAMVRVRKDHTVSAIATAGEQPVEGVTLLFSVAGSVTATGSCATDASGVCSFTYAGPDLPGADTVTACADANGNSAADPGEPCGTAAVTWVRHVLVVHAFGGGVIANAAGLARISFDFNFRRVGHHLKGHCHVVDRTAVAKVKLKCLDVTSITQAGTHVTITGDASIGGVATTYQIDASDAKKTGGEDTFQIQTASGYSASGSLVSGDIKVHRHWKTIGPAVPVPPPTPSPSPTG